MKTGATIVRLESARISSYFSSKEKASPAFGHPSSKEGTFGVWRQLPKSPPSREGSAEGREGLFLQCPVLADEVCCGRRHAQLAQHRCDLLTAMIGAVIEHVLKLVDQRLRVRVAFQVLIGQWLLKFFLRQSVKIYLEKRSSPTALSSDPLSSSRVGISSALIMDEGLWPFQRNSQARWAP